MVRKLELKSLELVGHLGNRDRSSVMGSEHGGQCLRRIGTFSI